MDKRIKIVRASTVPESIHVFCSGLLRRLDTQEGYDIVVVSSPGDTMAEISRDEGVRTVSVSMERRIAPLHDLRSLVRLVGVFRRERPTMVHSITPKAGLLCMMAGWLTRVPVRLHTFTGLVFPTSTGLKRHILMATDRLTCACATHVVPEGQGVKDDLENYGITRKPLHVLGHGNIRGIDLQHFRHTPEVTAEAGKLRRPGVFTFVFIGRLVGDKGINELVDAFCRLHVSHPDTRLVLVGRHEENIDPLKPGTLARISDNAAIETVGHQADVRPWLAAADAFVFPSYREGFPNVVIEAGAMGLPSIVTDINGSREIVVHGKNGVIVPPRDANALHDAMARLLTDNALRRQLADNARPMVASRYDRQYVQQCLIDYYNTILKPFSR